MSGDIFSKTPPSVTNPEQVPPAASGVRTEPPCDATGNLSEKLAWCGQVLDNRNLAELVAPQRKHAWLVCAPKSGSTYLTAILDHVLQWPSNFLVRSWERREQEVDLRSMLAHLEGNLFSGQQHCRMSVATREFIGAFRVKVLLQGRNLLDSIVSYRDHLVRESVAVPAAFVPPAFVSWPEERQLDFVIHMVVPWYFSFYAGWFAAIAEGAVQCHWVGYEDLTRDPRRIVTGILEYLGEARSDGQIAEAIAAAGGKAIRLNVGRSGRGASSLSRSQKDLVERYRAYYSEIDFSRIGL